jgi:hypothetical protein
MSDEQLATQLKEESERLLSFLELEEGVSPFGALKRVGSAALDLMTWRDLDLQVKMERGSSVELFNQLFCQYNGVRSVRRLYAIRFEGDYRPGMSRGHYFGMVVDFEGADWKIDLWVLSPEEQRDSDGWMARATGALDAQARRLILRLKQQAMVDGRVPKGVSRQICEWVLLEGLRDEAELQERCKGLGYRDRRVDRAGDPQAN